MRHASGGAEPLLAPPCSGVGISDAAQSTGSAHVHVCAHSLPTTKLAQKHN